MKEVEKLEVMCRIAVLQLAQCPCPCTVCMYCTVYSKMAKKAQNREIVKQQNVCRALKSNNFCQAEVSHMNCNFLFICLRMYSSIVAFFTPTLGKL
jgi:hypothetical protein